MYHNYRWHGGSCIYLWFQGKESSPQGKERVIEKLKFTSTLFKGWQGTNAGSSYTLYVDNVWVAMWYVWENKKISNIWMFANDVSLSFHFCHSYCVEAKNHSLRSWLFASRIVFFRKKNGAIHILWLYEIYFSYFVYPFLMWIAPFELLVITLLQQAFHC